MPPQTRGSLSVASILKRPVLWRFSAISVFLFAIYHFKQVCFASNYDWVDYPIQVLSVQRILHGERPYRDFQVLYGPLGHYLAAAFQWPLRFHEPTFAFNCYVFAGAIVLSAILCLLLARLRLARPVFLALVVLLLLQDVVLLGIVISYSLLAVLVLVAVILLLPYTVSGEGRTGTRLAQVGVGVLIASEIFIRINFAVYLVVAIVIVAVTAWFFGRRSIAVAALRCLMIATLFSVVLLAVFAAVGIASPWVADMREYLPRASAGRQIKWKDSHVHPLYFVTAIALASLLFALPARLKKRQVDFSCVPLVLLCGLASYAFFRLDLQHLFPFVVISLVSVLTWPQVETPDVPLPQAASNSFFGLREFQLLALLVLSTQWGVYNPLAPLTRHLHLHMAKAAATGGPSAQVESMEILHGVALGSAEVQMIDRLDRLRKPGEEVFWMTAPGACQSTFDKCVNLNLYLGESILPKQHIWFFDTPSTVYEDVQSRIVAGLEQKQTPWIGVQDVYHQNPVGIAHAEAHLLYDYVGSHYRRVFTAELPGDNRHFYIYERMSK